MKQETKEPILTETNEPTSTETNPSRSKGTTMREKALMALTCGALLVAAPVLAACGGGDGTSSDSDAA
ncbi:MAG: hypothetical protein HUU35_01915, partial [Armatimonadetes bacterium]|nr:hypothetical protein [Armatimonadota bacterium]